MERDELLERRNATAVHGALVLLQGQVHEQRTLIDALTTALGGMVERMAALERLVVQHKATSVGHGPSVK